MDAESIINFIDKGGAITSDELRQYLYEMQRSARYDGAEGYRKFILDRVKRGKDRKERRKDHECGQIILDTAEYLYKLRRLRNGQELTDLSDEDTEEVSGREIQKGGAGKEDRRFWGSEKIKI